MKLKLALTAACVMAAGVSAMASDLEMFGLKGPVKEVKTVQTEPGSDFSFETVYTFSPSGELTLVSGEQPGIERDSEGRIWKLNVESYDDAGDPCVDSFTLTYDENGRVSKVDCVTVFDEFTMKFTYYDTNGLAKKQTSANQVEMTETSFINYADEDSHGNWTKRTSYMSRSGYNNGRKWEYTSYDAPTAPNETRTIIYYE